MISGGAENNSSDGGRPWLCTHMEPHDISGELDLPSNFSTSVKVRDF